MTHADGSPYTLAERKAIVQEARQTAAKLLERLETLAQMESDREHIAAKEARADDRKQ